MYFCDRILGANLWGKQQEIATSVRDYREVYIPSCHGSGKSYSLGNIVLWALYAHSPSIIITTAPTNRQVEKVLWQEIRRAHGRSIVPLGGNLLNKELKLDDKWFAFGFSSDDPSNFSGSHEAYVLVVIDEATGIKQAHWEAIEGLLSNERAHLVAIGNPTDPASEFCLRVQNMPKGARVIHISAFDTPNFTRAGITQADIANGTWEQKLAAAGGLANEKLVTPRWVAGIYAKYGPDSPMWVSRVLGQVPQSSTDTLIPLSWALAAVERWKERTELLERGIQTFQGGDQVLGVDVARYGDDLSCRCFRDGYYVHPLQVSAKEDNMTTAGRVMADHAAHPHAPIRVDVGMGTGVIDRLRELHVQVEEFNFGAESSDPVRWDNLKAEGFWHLRSLFEQNLIMIPDDEDLIRDLTQMKYKIINSEGTIRMEKKEDMKKRTGFSPDRADALMMAFAHLPEGPAFSINFF